MIEHLGVIKNMLHRAYDYLVKSGQNDMYEIKVEDSTKRSQKKWKSSID